MSITRAAARAAAEAREPGVNVEAPMPRVERIQTKQLLRLIIDSDDYILAFFGDRKNPPMSRVEAEGRVANYFGLREQADRREIGGDSDNSSDREQTGEAAKSVRRHIRRLKNRQARLDKDLEGHEQCRSWYDVKAVDLELCKKLQAQHEPYFVIRSIIRKALELEAKMAADKLAAFRRTPSVQLTVPPSPLPSPRTSTNDTIDVPPASNTIGSASILGDGSTSSTSASPGPASFPVPNAVDREERPHLVSVFSTLSSSKKRPSKRAEGISVDLTAENVPGAIRSNTPVTPVAPSISGTESIPVAKDPAFLAKQSGVAYLSSGKRKASALNPPMLSIDGMTTEPSAKRPSLDSPSEGASSSRMGYTPAGSPLTPMDAPASSTSTFLPPAPPLRSGPVCRATSYSQNASSSYAPRINSSDPRRANARVPFASPAPRAMWGSATTIATPSMPSIDSGYHQLDRPRMPRSMAYASTKSMTPYTSYGGATPRPATNSEPDSAYGEHYTLPRSAASLEYGFATPFPAYGGSTPMPGSMTPFRPTFDETPYPAAKVSKPVKQSRQQSEQSAQVKGRTPIWLAPIKWGEFTFDAELFRALKAHPINLESLRGDMRTSAKRSTAAAPGLRPRWKVERDLYVCVQAVDPVQGWIKVATAQKWIKKSEDGKNWLTEVSWNESLDNPIGERLEHWKTQWQTSAQEGTLNEFRKHCPFASVVEILFDGLLPVPAPEVPVPKTMFSDPPLEPLALDQESLGRDEARALGRPLLPSVVSATYLSGEGAGEQLGSGDVCDDTEDSDDDDIDGEPLTAPSTPSGLEVIEQPHDSGSELGARSPGNSPNAEDVDDRGAEPLPASSETLGSGPADQTDKTSDKPLLPASTAQDSATAQTWADWYAAWQSFCQSRPQKVSIAFPSSNLPTTPRKNVGSPTKTPKKDSLFETASRRSTPQPIEKKDDVPKKADGMMSTPPEVKELLDDLTERFLAADQGQDRCEEGPGGLQSNESKVDLDDEQPSPLRGRSNARPRGAFARGGDSSLVRDSESKLRNRRADIDHPRIRLSLIDAPKRKDDARESDIEPSPSHMSEVLRDKIAKNTFDPTSAQDWLEYSYADRLPRKLMPARLDQEYDRVWSVNNRSRRLDDIVHDAKVDVLLQNLRSIYQMRGKHRVRWTKHQVVFAEPTFKYRIGSMPPLERLVELSGGWRLFDMPADAVHFGRSNRTFFEIHYDAPGDIRPRTIRGASLKPISLLSYLRLLLKNIIDDDLDRRGSIGKRR